MIGKWFNRNILLKIFFILTAILFLFIISRDILINGWSFNLITLVILAVLCLVALYALIFPKRLKFVVATELITYPVLISLILLFIFSLFSHKFQPGVSFWVLVLLVLCLITACSFFIVYRKKLDEDYLKYARVVLDWAEAVYWTCLSVVLFLIVGNHNGAFFDFQTGFYLKLIILPFMIQTRFIKAYVGNLLYIIEEKKSNETKTVLDLEYGKLLLSGEFPKNSLKQWMRKINLIRVTLLKYQKILFSIILVIVSIILTPILINYFVLWDSGHSKGNVGDWIAFFGNYSGGIIGAIVAFLIVKYQFYVISKKDIENKLISQIPILYRLKFEFERKILHVFGYISDYYNDPINNEVDKITRTIVFPASKVLEAENWRDINFLGDTKLLIDLIKIKEFYIGFIEVFEVDIEELKKNGELKRVSDYVSLKEGYWKEFNQEEYLKLSNETYNCILKRIEELEIKL
jgi:hypothetical protein